MTTNGEFPRVRKLDAEALLDELWREHGIRLRSRRSRRCAAAAIRPL
jgi:hypothetical protein